MGMKSKSGLSAEAEDIYDGSEHIADSSRRRFPLSSFLYSLARLLFLSYFLSRSSPARFDNQARIRRIFSIRRERFLYPLTAEGSETSARIIELIEI